MEAAPPAVRPRAERAVLAILTLLGLALWLLLWQFAHTNLTLHTRGTQLATFFAAFAVFAMAVAIVWRLGYGASRRALWLIVLVGVALRLSLAPVRPVTTWDVYRYLWEGRVVVAGENPFSEPPISPGLTALRDPLWKEVRFPRVPAAYPPVAQYVFALSRLLPTEPVVTLKLLLALFDIGTVLLLPGLLVRLRRPPAWTLVYAWHPLIVGEVVARGHLDSVGIFFLVLAASSVVGREGAVGSRIENRESRVAAAGLGVGSRQSGETALALSGGKDEPTAAAVLTPLAPLSKSGEGGPVEGGTPPRASPHPTRYARSGQAWAIICRPFRALRSRIRNWRVCFRVGSHNQPHLHRPLGSAAAGAVLAASVLAKGYAIVAVPFFLLAARRRGWFLAGLVGAAVVAYLPFALAGPDLVRGMRLYATLWHDYAPVYPLVKLALARVTADPDLVARRVLMIATGAWVLLLLLVKRERSTAWALDRSFLALAGLFLLSPVLYSWYLSWTVPFLCLRPRPAWLLLTGTIFAFYAHAYGGAHVQVWWVSLVQFAPPALLAGALWFGKSPPAADFASLKEETRQGGRNGYGRPPARRRGEGGGGEGREFAHGDTQ